MSIASVCKGKKKNQSPFSRTRKSCRSASCLLGVSFPTLKKKKKKKNRKKEKEEKEKMGGGEKERKRKGKRKKKKKKNLAQLSCRCVPPRVTWCSGLVLSFHSRPLLPASGWDPESPSGSSVCSPEGCSLSSKKKKKRLLQPLLPAKLRFPLLAISNSKAVFVAKLLPLPLNPGNSNVGGG